MTDWQDISTAPKDGTPVLVSSPRWLIADVGMIDGSGLWYDPGDGSVFQPQPTHWMPLPPPPTKG